MHCPFCRAEDTKVVDSRLGEEGTQVKRRRECLQCEERFTTYETAKLVLPRIIKRDGTREDFNEDKLRSGLLKALEKRPVNTELVDAAILRIIHQLRQHAEREVAADQLGEWVIDELKKLDEVAYVRFASVYRSFQDVNEFYQVIQKLLKKK